MGAKCSKNDKIPLTNKTHCVNMYTMYSTLQSSMYGVEYIIAMSLRILVVYALGFKKGGERIKISMKQPKSYAKFIYFK